MTKIKEKAKEVRILSITAATSFSGNTGSGSVYGLGDDNNIYEWHTKIEDTQAKYSNTWAMFEED